MRIDSYRGRIVSVLDFPEASEGQIEKTADLTAGVIGKHAVYFEFLSEEDGEIASFDRYTFS